jgi:hypothetical protein
MNRCKDCGCTAAAEMAVMMYLKGRAELGITAALKAIPIALAIAAAAKAIVDRGLQNRWGPHAAAFIGKARELRRCIHTQSQGAAPGPQHCSAALLSLTAGSP